ncbi:hypothetical protein RB653_006626 [Dictyostelium firmibasis]|uniref:Uncharacterized protein n=1 Tax=Dictyostelium firmibasis TaxID=79012 RepID=A0AAN7U2I7_9MYCE
MRLTTKIFSFFFFAKILITFLQIFHLHSMINICIFKRTKTNCKRVLHSIKKLT